MGAKSGRGWTRHCPNFCPCRRYLVTTLMGADLNNIVKCQTLSDEHVQFLVYQLLRGLKVGCVGSGVPWTALGWGRAGWSLGSPGLPSPAVYPLGRHHPPGR